MNWGRLEKVVSQNGAFSGEWQVERGRDLEMACSTDGIAKEWR